MLFVEYWRVFTTACRSRTLREMWSTKNAKPRFARCQSPSLTHASREVDKCPSPGLELGTVVCESVCSNHSAMRPKRRCRGAGGSFPEPHEVVKIDRHGVGGAGGKSGTSRLDFSMWRGRRARWGGANDWNERGLFGGERGFEGWVGMGGRK